MIWKEGKKVKEETTTTTVKKKKKCLDVCPTGWEKTTIPSMKLYNQLLVVKCFRPDLVPNGCRTFVSIVFSEKFFDNTSTNLEDFVRKSESKNIEPYLFVSLPGYDASSRVVSYAEECKAKLQSFAMGSPEGYNLAEKAINDCAKMGGWVLLKNVHLSPSWLAKLEKSLHRKVGNSKFKLFLTMELNPKVPANLFRMSTVVIFEPPVGLKSALVRTFGNMPKARVNKKTSRT
jgi:dynein heavy chain 1